MKGKCKYCKKEVEELVGLFVPHLCKECLDKKRKKQIKEGDVCSLCHKAYCDCYC